MPWRPRPLPTPRWGPFIVLALCILLWELAGALIFLTLSFLFGG